MKYSLWVFLTLLWVFAISCSNETQPSENDAEKVSLEDEFEDDEFDDDEFDDDEFEDDEIEPAKTKVTPVKKVVRTAKVAQAKPNNSTKAKPKSTSAPIGSISKQSVKFQPTLGGWMIEESNGNGFIVTFLDDNKYLFSSELTNKKFQFKGYDDWRLPTFDEAIYLLDLMPFNKMSAANKEFWTSTRKGARIYIFNGEKGIYRLSNENDSTGVLLVRTI
jgi:hypothetical protein